MRTGDETLGPQGKLTIQTVAFPKNTNANGDIYAGWLVEQMDLAAATTAGQLSQGRATTVAIERIEFLCPVSVGDQVSCYTELMDSGRSSMKIRVEVYVSDARGNKSAKVTEGVFIYVAINEMGGIRELPNQD